MRKISLALLLCLFLSLVIGRAEAGDLETYMVANATATRAQTQIAVTTIVPGKDVILGFRLAPYGSSSTDPFVSLHDCAAVADQTVTSAGNLFDIMETDNTPYRSEVTWYPKPKNLSLGLSVHLGPHMILVVFYERAIN